MGGLDTLPDAPAVARIVMAATGEAPADLRIAGQGATALAWRVETAGGPLAVLIALPEGRRTGPVNFAARAAVLERLHARHPRCPRPVATSRSDGIPHALRGGLEWLVTTWVDGAPAGGPLPEAAARDVGTLLRALHSIPAAGYGPVAGTAGELRGGEETQAAGLLARWPGLWPFDGRPLVAHPLVQAAPHLVMPASALRDQLLRYAGVPAASSCHTDLDPSHLLLRDGRLAGVVDFGDAAVVPPAFDLASFAYWHGWHATEAVLEAYEPNGVLRDVRRAEAQQLAVVLALQKIEKFAAPETRERRAHAVEFLATTLPLAARRTDA